MPRRINFQGSGCALRFYWKYVRIILPFFIFSVLCMCVESGVELIQPTLLSNILDIGVANGDFSYVARTSGIMLLAVLFYAAAAFTRNILSTKGSQWFAFHMRADVYKKIQSLTPDELNRFGAGTLMTRVTNDITQLQNMTMGLMRVCIKAPILCLGGIVMAWRLNARLAVIPIVSTVIIFGLIAINIRYGFPLYTKVQAALDRVNTVIREYLSGVRVVKAFNRFNFERRRFDGPNEELRRTSTFVSRVMAIFNPAVTLIIYIGIVYIYWDGGVQIELLTVDKEGSFQQVAVMGLSADRFSGCASVAAGVGADGRHYLVLDGWTGISGNNLASVLLYFDEDTQQMVPADQISTEKLYTASLRNVPSLVSQDLDGDGIVEIPTQPDEAGLLNMSQSRRMDFIVWMDYTSPNPEKSFGLLDEETNCYIELPMEWEGNLKLTDSEQYDGAVELRTVDEDELVMTLRLVRTTSSLKGWTRLGIVASRQMQAKLAPDVEISDKNYRLSKALHLLN